jgi:hypothetical protein
MTKATCISRVETIYGTRYTFSNGSETCLADRTDRSLVIGADYYICHAKGKVLFMDIERVHDDIKSLLE